MARDHIKPLISGTSRLYDCLEIEEQGYGLAADTELWGWRTVEPRLLELPRHSNYGQKLDYPPWPSELWEQGSKTDRTLRRCYIVGVSFG